MGDIILSMRSKIENFVVPLMVLAAICEISRAANPPVAGSPLGSGTVPPTTYQSGLIRSPNPMNPSRGNLDVTGNLRGNSYFRGVVPYGSTYDFGAAAGSSYLDSFVRSSAGAESYTGYSRRGMPYYGSNTTAGIIPGTRGVVMPPAVNPTGYGYSIYSQRILPMVGTQYSQTTTGPEAPYSYYGTPVTPTTVTSGTVGARPMSPSALELEKKIFGNSIVPAEGAAKFAQQQTNPANPAQPLRQYPAENKQTTQETSPQMPQNPLQSTLVNPTEKPVQTAERNTTTLIDTLSKPAISSPQAKLVTAEKPEQMDVYEQMKKQVEDFQKSYKEQQALAAKQNKPAAAEKQPAEANAVPEKEQTSQEKLAAVIQNAAEAKGILGEYKSFTTYSQDRFNQCLKAGEENLKQSKYYKAADAYTLAGLYKPNDPLPNAGKSYALFAAGEYLSSSLYLSRAIYIFPEYVLIKVDLASMLGGRDIIEKRLADIQKLIGMSEAPELEFLIGYIYYQTGRLDLAKKNADSAAAKMPQSAPAQIMKKAIDDAAAK